MDRTMKTTTLALGFQAQEYDYRSPLNVRNSACLLHEDHCSIVVLVEGAGCGRIYHLFRGDVVQPEHDAQE